MSQQESTTTYRAPRRWTDRSFARAGLEIIDFRLQLVGCVACEHRWIVLTRGGGRPLRRGWWHCPEGCNVPEE